MNQPKHIAVVDDHTLFRKGLCMLINLFPNYTVVLDAANGKDFICQLDPQHLPDILLLDIVMPEMDGYTLTAWVHASYPAIKILALSTMDSETAIIHMFLAGAAGYLHKDAEPSMIKQTFEEVLSDCKSPALVKTLTKSELAFLQLNCSDKNNYELAREMFVSVRTIDFYRDSLYNKLQLSNRVELALFAVRNGIVKV